jgi:hypothetical protein
MPRGPKGEKRPADVIGAAITVSGPVIASHSAENTGTADCKQIFVEKKQHRA